MTFSYTLLLLGVTVAVSFYAYDNRSWFEKLSFRPYSIKHNRGEAYRFLSYAFVHADLLHLVFNMMVLYMFGELLERHFYLVYGKLGLYYFILLYFGGALFATIPGFIKHRNNIVYTVVGASGATSALVFSYIALEPVNKLGLFFLPGIPAIVFGILILISEYYLSKRGGTNIAHDAHIYGSIYGFLFTLLIDRDNFSQFILKLEHGFS